MATKTLYFPDIKNGWYVSYSFLVLAGWGYTVDLNDDLGNNYAHWIKPNDGSDYPNKIIDTFWYKGSDGALICTIDCPKSNRLDNTWAESIITPSSGSPTLGRTYCAIFEDNGMPIEYNNLSVYVTGWAFYNYRVPPNS
ncbi:hypothetical protein [Xenorhabdus innexi]|uniref:Uncharacterized protein n=1 Tax=Xenorhabdus innexi TaxID=290109 RepID=A0A1N6N1R1_9GAMM|nr:hypothetical protein [Xenorhabdus innexi]PHM29094.1 hypothetical protein Xinn_03713 [Xenorhabdus innexi]SIP74962.1 conserved hypothetical protein [Xenorhabdus innexi]